jgi:ribosomal protein L7/L12
MYEKLRQKLYTAIYLSEIMKSNLDKATAEYDLAKAAVHEIINQLAPLDTGLTAEQEVGVLNRRKIALIKLIRTVSAQGGGSVLELKEAKDMVEDWIGTINAPTGPKGDAR